MFYDQLSAPTAHRAFCDHDRIIASFQALCFLPHAYQLWPCNPSQVKQSDPIHSYPQAKVYEDENLGDRHSKDNLEDYLSHTIPSSVLPNYRYHY